MVDPPWRFDPFQNMKTVHWGKKKPGWLAVGISYEGRVTEFIAKTWAPRLITANGAADFIAGTTPDGVTASPMYEDRVVPGMDIGSRSRTFTVDLSKFKPDQGTFKAEIPPEPHSDGSTGTLLVPKTLYVVWLNEDNGGTPDSPSQPVESGMAISNFRVDGALDFNAAMTATAPDGTSGNRFIYAKTFPHRSGPDPWTKAGITFDGERAVFDDPDVAQAVADSSIAWVDEQGNEGPSSYHVEQVKEMAPYPDGGDLVVSGWNFSFSTYKNKSDIKLDRHFLPTSPGLMTTGFGGACWINSVTVQLLCSASPAEANLAPAGNMIPSDS